jgi:hypothetical protein
MHFATIIYYTRALAYIGETNDNEWKRKRQIFGIEKCIVVLRHDCGWIVGLMGLFDACGWMQINDTNDSRSHNPIAKCQNGSCQNGPSSNLKSFSKASVRFPE